MQQNIAGAQEQKDYLLYMVTKQSLAHFHHYPQFYIHSKNTLFIGSLSLAEVEQGGADKLIVDDIEAVGGFDHFLALGWVRKFDMFEQLN